MQVVILVIMDLRYTSRIGVGTSSPVVILVIMDLRYTLEVKEVDLEKL